MSSGLAKMIRKYSLLWLSPPAEVSLCCRAGRLGRKKKKAHVARWEASTKERGTLGTVAVKHLIKNASPTLLSFVKSTARFSKPSRKCTRLFVVSADWDT